MNQGLSVVIGMTVSYLFSFAGLLCALTYYRKHHRRKTSTNP
jgi:hypothetical protein